MSHRYLPALRSLDTRGGPSGPWMDSASTEMPYCFWKLSTSALRISSPMGMMTDTWPSCLAAATVLSHSCCPAALAAAAEGAVDDFAALDEPAGGAAAD